MPNKSILLYTIIVLVFYSCTQDHKTKDINIDIFTPLESKQIGIHFRNDLPINDTMNYFSYGYYYMGGGVAIADFDSNGSADIFFTGNVESNALYLNKGEFQFDDITKAAGLDRSGYWHTGCSIE